MIRESAESTGSAARLWELISDLEAWAERIPTVDTIRHVAGPVAPGVGSRYEMSQTGLPTSVYEITEWDEAARSFAWVSSAPGVRTTATHTVSATPTGSRLDLSVGFAGPLGRVMGRLMRAKAAAMVRSEAETFARLAEQV